MIADSGLAPLLGSCYDPDFRNTFNHNNYEIRMVDGGSTFVDIQTGRQWGDDQIWSLLLAMQQAQLAILMGIQVALSVDDESIVAGLKECGTVAVTCTIEGVVPVISIFQLWCFRDLEPSGLWLDRARIAVISAGDGRQKIQVTERAYSEGERLGDAWLEHARRSGWAHIRRIPVAPNLGLGHPVLTGPDGAQYEVLGPADEHVAPIAVDSV